MDQDKASNQHLVERIARLEGALGWEEGTSKLSPKLFFLSLLLIAGGIYCGIEGLGQPNHYYQWVLGGLIVGICYQRRALMWPSAWYQWVLAGFNAVSLSIALKLILGGGERFPFFWFKYPFLRSERPQGKLLNVIPDLNLTWEPTPLALWSMDLTMIQSFLVILVLMGVVFGFQLFVSLVGFLLVLVSLPALVAYEWDWVFPALICIGSGIYLQSARSQAVWRISKLDE